MTMDASPTIQLATGRYFDLRNPQDHAYSIIEIGLSLSRLCRFNGHTISFYSVAQHSVLVSHIVPKQFALEALLHDAAEAYIGDVSSPLKAMLPDLQAIETRIDKAIRRDFGLPDTLSRHVKAADRIALATERRDLMLEQDTRWPILDGYDPLPDVRIKPMQPEAAYDAFLTRMRELSSGAQQRKLSA